MRRAADIDRIICHLASTTLSVVHARQLRDAGVSRGNVATRVARGWMARMLGDVYAVGPACLAPTFEMECMAGVLQCGDDARIDGVTGASLMELWNRRVDEIHVSTPHHATRTVAEGPYRFRRDRGVWLPAEPLAAGPIPVADAVHLAARCAEQMTQWQVAFVIGRAIYLRLATLEDFECAVAQRHGHIGNATLRRAVELTRAGSSGTRSATEDACLADLLRAGAPVPIVNVRGAMGLSRDEPDFVFPGPRHNIECDGGHHDQPGQASDDAARDADAAALGWNVLRFRARDYWRRRAFVVRELARFLRGGRVEMEPGSRTLVVR